MVNEIQYTSIKRVLDNLLDHPLLSDVTLEQAIRHTIRFIALHGYNRLYLDKNETIPIHEFRGVLPCDLIRIIQVRKADSKICLRSMTDSFTPGMNPVPPHPNGYPIPPHLEAIGEASFKTQGRIIFTSFPEGEVEIDYKAIPVDEDGFPLLIDNETYLAALEAYIKKQVFTVKFDTGKISQNILQNAQQEYAYLAGQLQSEMTLPSHSEMQSISAMLNTMIPRMSEFYRGFHSLGNREYLRNH